MMTETVVNVQEAPNNNATSKPPQPGHQRQGTTESKLAWIKINLEYFKTTPGILKLVEIAFGIICMATASPAYYGGTHFFLFVATASFILTVIWVFVYMLGIREALKLPINWILSELVNTAFWSLMYIVAFIIQLIVAATTSRLFNFRDAYITAGVFGLFNAITYSFATYLLYVEWNSSKTTN